MGLYIPGVAGFATFYSGILGVGIWEAVLKRKKIQQGQDQMLLGNRDLGIFCGVFSLIATWVGGAFVNGTAEMMFARGLAWCQVPICYSLSLLFGAILFVKPMRKAEYITMLDPLQQRYGAKIGGLLFIPALCGDLFWCGAVLRALGSYLSVITGLDTYLSVCVSALLAAIYSLFGGMYYLAGTDALQLICIMLGLGISAPYIIFHPAVALEKNLARQDWIGEIKNEDLGLWADGALLLIFGGIPWQGYFRRVLSMKSSSMGRTLSITSMIGCMALAVPAALMGVVARATDWYLVEGYNRTISTDNGNAILPLILRLLTPQWVSFIGLGSMAAAAMSSADSSILSSSSMFARNIYRFALRPKASERELKWILRFAVIAVTSLSTGVAITFGSIYQMSFLCSEFAYVVLFPQLLSVIYWPSLVNTCGYFAGFATSILCRLAAGEKSVGIPVFIEYPFFDRNTNTQRFPYRTTAMISGLLMQLVVSFITKLFLKDDYSSGKSKNQTGVVLSNSGAALIDSTLNESSSGPSTLDGDRMSTSMTMNSQLNRYDASNEFYQITKSCTEENIQIANQSLRNLQNLQESVRSPNRLNPIPHPPVINHTGQILGVRNLTNSLGQPVLPIKEMNNCLPNSIKHVDATMLNNSTPYAKSDKLRGENDKIADRSNMELNLNLHDGTGILKKNVKGVKLIGMETGTLRRPSLQGTFSPTPSVELVHILDRRQSNGSFGPSSLSPVPGVEACKTHGTAMGGHGGNEHCRIKRGIVRHHSFNETGDRILTTLARQPTYPSMPLRPEDGRMTLRRDKRPHSIIARHSSIIDDKNIHISSFGTVTSPTCGMHTPTVQTCNYFLADDEAVSRF
ncbi:high-affinity choline transporter 1-like [Leptopilina heterotoma]|uniref:high-affinity choline transporter 1-like n=1 Tax=Leptopilina heterotoma TaxID=63436 RepID=UPI001CA91DFF|nr:high-affinity choline transporter 1-like [Leptopilina heterotoma]XP_043473207.1 high-affinity choline transporter 1-like [Leptopilina heterotoma]